MEARRPLRVVAAFPEPTPYRAPLLDLIAARADLDLLVTYAAGTVAGRTWDTQIAHPHVVLRGVRIPTLGRVLRHQYPVDPRIWRLLDEHSPQCVVVSGWSTFASQAAIAWCRMRDVPYVLVVESHDRGPRAGWRRLVKGAVVPRVVRSAAGVLVTGSLARASMLARGARPDRIGLFANTVDVTALGELADRLAGDRPALRASFGASSEDVVVLCAARLAREKGIDVLIDAVAALADPRVLLLLAGEGSERPALERRASLRGIRLHAPGELAGERLAAAYVSADIFALLSRHEPWGVVVNEAAACGLPLVLSDPVGAAWDLLESGRNGRRVPAEDPRAAAEALRPLVASADERRRAGAASRHLAAAWGYEPSVRDFVDAVRRATGVT